MKLTKKPGLDSIVSAENEYSGFDIYEKQKWTGGIIVKRWKWILAAGAIVLGCAGCGASPKPAETGAVDTKPVDVVQTESASEEAPASAPTESEIEQKNDNYEDLEEKAADGDTSVFAGQIQAAVAAKDMDALAKLCAFPLAVNGEAVETEEAFMSLGADAVFTEERCAVIEAVDVSALEETAAGVIMGDATPNIIFNSVDGELRITGIN